MGTALFEDPCGFPRFPYIWERGESRDDPYQPTSENRSRFFQTGLEKGCKAAGIGYGRYKDFTFHTLRHTFKTDCRRAGIADHVSEAIMGHSDGNSMSKRYDEVTDQDRLEAVVKLLAYRIGVRQNVSFEQKMEAVERS